MLRLTDRDTRIRGMNMAAAATREDLKQARKSHVWPRYVARLVDANPSLMVRVRSFERAGQPERRNSFFPKV